MRKKLILGNWKMNGSLAMLADYMPQLIARAPESVSIGICPPTAYLGAAQSYLKDTPIALGAQNVTQFEQGAYTGETSVSMQKDLGVRYVLVGHSERREFFGDTDAIVAEKYAVIGRAGLIPVLCIGETEQERNDQQTEAVIVRQIDDVINRMGPDAFANGVIAYEPIWAIGTGNTATPEQAQAVHRLIRSHVAALNSEHADRLPILYGGSMKAANAAELLAMPDIDGGLIGGASLDSEEFLQICQAAAAAQGTAQ